MLEGMELVNKWITALRSDKYEQGNGFMRYNNKYCCLGVLCDVYDSSQWHSDPEEDTSDTYGDEIMFATLPKGLKEIINLSDDEQKDLILMNDQYHKTFSEIADKIEEIYAQKDKGQVD